ncbi:YoaH family protein [Serratia sp. AKBS12]|uniref:YoaH family protein n=1 Tax=Serratia sp. AKBS12 TaxID=2974597 RepID=UPI002166ACC2|nr:YoaH family protein [Serratia sp. AKBS12]MCS3408282.1 YoaH family protein [Serratia sp. AKBS12]HEI8864613.1 YoaH family protein [Serratia odorifera]
MLAGMPSLNHLEQQEAADRIRQLMEQGMSSGEAIAVVAQQIREQHQGARVAVMFDDEDEDAPSVPSDVEPQDDEDEDDY